MKKQVLGSAMALGLVSAGAAAAPLDLVKGGKTYVRLSEALLDELDMGWVELEAIDGAKASRDGSRLRFKIEDGTIDIQDTDVIGEIFHDGGLRLTGQNGSQLTLLSFIIDTLGATPVITALVSVDGELIDRLPVFELVVTEDTMIAFNGDNGLKIRNLQLKLDNDAGDLLDSVFDTDLEDDLIAGEAGSGIRLDELESESDDDDESESDDDDESESDDDDESESDDDDESESDDDDESESEDDDSDDEDSEDDI